MKIGTSRGLGGRKGWADKSSSCEVNSDSKYAKLHHSLKHLIPVEVQSDQGN